MPPDGANRCLSEGSEFDVELDTLIVAISEEPESAGLDGIGRSRWGTVVINPESFLTDKPGVFAGGDVVTGPSTVIAAVAAGKKAAMMIDRYVSGKLLKVLPKVKLPTVYVEPFMDMDEETGEVVPAGNAAASCRTKKKMFHGSGIVSDRAAGRWRKRGGVRAVTLEFTNPQ